MKRTLKITEHHITVANIRSFDGKPYIVSFEAKGILPGCRNIATLSVSPSYNSVWVRNLYSHNGQANILPKDWARMLRTSKVIPDKHFPLPITWEIEQDAIHSVLEFCECNAITDDTDVCEQYKQTQTHDTLTF
jgi:hypothetical protein